MKKYYLSLFFILYSLFPICSAFCQPSLVKLQHDIESICTQMHQTKGLNGVVLVADKGKVIYKKAFGLADVKKNRQLESKSPFYLGSISKQFTTMGIMILKEAGQLSYDDPLSKYFPEFPDYAQKVTIRDMMTHTSGIPDHYDLGIYKKGLSNDDVLKTLVNQPLDFQPGEKYQYSNGGYVLLAMITEKVAGQSLHEFMQENIFQPLGMSASYVVHPGTRHAKNRAIGFSPKKSGEPLLSGDYEIFTTGAGGIYSNVDDLLKWDQALYTEKLVANATIKETFKPTPLNDGTLSDYGYGWSIVEEGKAVGHTGSLNGFRNFIDRNLEYQQTTIALTNNTAEYRGTLRDTLRAILTKYNIEVEKSRPISIQNVNVIDVETGTVKPNQTIIIEKGKIKSIKKSNNQETPGNAVIMDASGKYAMPGMVDAHIHFFQSGGLYTRPDAIDLRAHYPYEKEIQWLKDHAGDILKRYLACGITTVVDVGGPMYNYTLREQFQPVEEAPSIYLTGPLVSTYQPDAFKIEDAPIIKVSNEEEAINLVRKQVGFQPDFIKIWYIARKPQDAIDNYPIIEATMKEAKKHNLRVAVHATQLYTAKLAVKAGADLLVHSVDNQVIDQEFIDLLKAKGTIYNPTLVVSANYGKVFLGKKQFTKEDYTISHPKPLGSLMDLRHLPLPDFLPDYREREDFIMERYQRADSIKSINIQALLKAKVPIATGTDAGNIGTLHASSYYSELKAMKKAGMSNAQILEASTINGAKAVGKSDLFGSIKAGKRADLIILNNNPLENLENLKNPHSIVNKGVIINPDELIQPSPEDLAQQQLNAYNGHNLEAFLEPYAEDVRIYNFPNTLRYEGKEKMRETYQFIEQNPDLHCELVNRIVAGNTIIDQERVTRGKDRPPIKAIAIYKIKKGKIAEVYFIRQ